MRWFKHRLEVNPPLISLASGLLVLMGAVQIGVGVVLILR